MKARFVLKAVSIVQTKSTLLHLFKEDEKKRQVKRNIKIREEGSLGNVNEQLFSFLFCLSRNNYELL